MDKVKIKETVLTITLGFIALFLMFHKVWLLYAAFFTGLTGLIPGNLSLLVHNGWMKLADALGYVMSRLILGALYFIILVPVGALARLFRNDFMFLGRREDSYYHERNHLYRPEDFTDPW